MSDKDKRPECFGQAQGGSFSGELQGEFKQIGQLEKKGWEFNGHYWTSPDGKEPYTFEQAQREVEL